MADEADWVGLDEAFAELEAECTDIARGLTVRIWQGILAKTPQYLGGMAASWTYCINREEFHDRSNAVDPRGAQLDATRYRGPFDFEPLRKGDPAAIEVANLASAGKDRLFKLGDTVYITNGVDHGEGAYSVAVENGEVRLRAVNQRGAPVRRTLDWAGENYKDISKVKAVTLKLGTIG